jgi:cyclase
MRFKVLSYVVVLGLIVCQSALAADSPGLQRISDHVYAYVDTKNASPAGNSFGANTGVVVGRDAVLVIDTLISAKEADRFIADIRKVTDKPVKFVVNTHHHLDHAWGNCQFVKLGAAIIGQENARGFLTEAKQSFAHPEKFGLTAKDLEGTELQGPTITFSDSMTIDLGNVTVELRYPGTTHTNDSITAYVPEDKVLFVGDILFNRYHPYMADCDVSRWQQVLGELQTTPAVKIIPGHGPVSEKIDLENLKTYLREFDALARTLCAGKGAEDAPVIAPELIKRLPQQERTELPILVETNLRVKYLPQPVEQK